MAYATYDTLPDIWPAEGSGPRARLAALVEEAAALASMSQHSIDILIVGDSTTTAVGGGGRWFAHHLNALLAEYFGNCPASPWTDPGTDPQAVGKIINSNSVLNTTHISYTPDIAACQILPSMYRPLSIQTYQGDGGDTWNDIALMILPDGVNQGCVRRNGALANGLAADGNYVEVMAATYAGADAAGLHCTNEAADTPANLTAGGRITVGTTDFPYNFNVAPPGGHINWVRVLTGPYLHSTKAYAIARLHAKTNSTQIDIGLVRVRNPNPAGMGLVFASAGGYRAGAWFGSPGPTGDPGAGFGAGDCRDLLQALAPRIVLFDMSVNDAFSAGLSAADYMTEMWNPSGIHTVFGHHDNKGLVGEILAALPNALPIFVLPAHRGNDQTGTWATYDANIKQYAGVLQTIAAATGGIFVNARKILARLGWNSQGEDSTATWVKKDNWTAGTAMTTANFCYHPTNGTYYRCILNHTAAAGNEPGVGASWATYWTTMVWANDSAAISVGDMCQGVQWDRGLYRCITAHTRNNLGYSPGGDIGDAGDQYWRRCYVNLVDYVHPTEAGSEAFARVIAKAITGRHTHTSSSRPRRYR